MLIQACLNGALTKTDHRAIPISERELSREASACIAAGAEWVHLHPRDPEGHERLDPEVVDSVSHQVREACGAPVCVSTGAWIEPDIGDRVRMIESWHEPDFATVNLCEDGASDVMAALATAGVGIEAGLWSTDDVELLVASGFATQVERVLIEPVDVSAADAESVVAGIHEALDRHGLSAPRLQHGDGESTWILIRDAIRRGIATRIGFEDTLELPSGDLATSNADLVRAARRLGAGA